MYKMDPEAYKAKINKLIAEKKMKEFFETVADVYCDDPEDAIQETLTLGPDIDHILKCLRFIKAKCEKYESYEKCATLKYIIDRINKEPKRS